MWWWKAFETPYTQGSLCPIFTKGLEHCVQVLKPASDIVGEVLTSKKTDSWERQGMKVLQMHSVNNITVRGKFQMSPCCHLIWINCSSFERAWIICCHSGPSNMSAVQQLPIYCGIDWTRHIGLFQCAVQSHKSRHFLAFFAYSLLNFCPSRCNSRSKRRAMWAATRVDAGVAHGNRWLYWGCIQVVFLELCEFKDAKVAEWLRFWRIVLSTILLE